MDRASRLHAPAQRPSSHRPSPLALPSHDEIPAHDRLRLVAPGFEQLRSSPIVQPVFSAVPALLFDADHRMIALNRLFSTLHHEHLEALTVDLEEIDRSLEAA